MNQSDIKKIVENLVQTFLDAGKISLDLRKKGLTKKIKSDNTPVSNGDLEVNEILTKKISELTPNIPIISEETSENKLINNLENFWEFEKIIDLAEPLGTETQLFIKLQNKEIISRMYNPREVEGGENIKFSVILSVYNGEAYLEETINSVLNQSYKYFEFI